MRSKKVEEAPSNLLQDLCGSDSDLYGYLSRNLYETPMTAISTKDLDTLTQEGEQSGNFGQAIDKAIFEGAQNAGESQQYVSILQGLAAKAIGATEQEKAGLDQEGSTGRVAALNARIEQQTFLSERAEDILRVSSEFYAEKLLELGENTDRKERSRLRARAENEEQIIGKREESGKKERRRELRQMGRKERKEAKKQDKLDQLASEEGKAARGQERQKAAQDEIRLRETEEKDRETRRSNRTDT